MAKRKDKLLAEWFWIDRWDGSSAALLPIAARGLYREMLSAAWRRGARLPNDHEAIQRAIRCTSEEWAACWPKVAPYWREDGDSIVNDTQLEVYAEAKAAVERASKRGLAGAQATAQARAQATAQATDGRVLKRQPPSPSPSPSPVSVERMNGRGERPNPFVQDRPALERESLALTREIAELTGEDPPDVFAKAADYHGAQRTKLNPASMSDDRLLATVRDLRANLEAARKKHGRAAGGTHV